MLKVYAAQWCPHCIKTIEYLKEHNIEFEYIDMDTASEEIINKIIEVNGGDDWVVPTMEFNGKWRPGAIYVKEMLEADLKEMGVI